ncbi:hypothetical protein MWN33_15250 [Starkeya koreensis]|uniref:O-antigen ligase n=1 Tax=Ancylobacter koreensis TaxID=266121 RepID=A0ABT0DQ32_9HYPH|nr:hypothetical protein [Ancylobacter koreensis]MCK0209391.1 hypothetical protein [Ancylobacter koreensis]
MRVAGRRKAAVTLPRAFTPVVEPQTGERFSGAMTMALLLGCLPLFAQSFYYLHEFTLPYLLSKGWPVLTLPASLYAALRLQLPARRLYLIYFAYALGLTPFISILQLGNGLVDAIITTVKIWPLTYYFGLSAVLFWLSPTFLRTKTALVVLGAGTFILMLALWILMPSSSYVNDPQLGKLFMIEEERGYRIYMPMFFGALYLFYLTRSFIQRPNVLVPLAILLGFVLLLTIYKQRAAIAAMFLVCGYGFLISLAPRLRLLAGGLAVATVPLALAYFMLRDIEGLTDSLGGSLTVRQTSFALGSAFLGEDPWRWLFGVGATTRFGSITLADIFQNSNFYVADLGWFGVVFEYGIVGAVLLAGLYVLSYFVLLRAARVGDDPMQLALSDYVLYMLITSPVYSLVFTPGELGVVLALGVYMSRVHGRLPSTAAPAHRISFSTHRHRTRT